MNELKKFSRHRWFFVQFFDFFDQWKNSLNYWVWGRVIGNLMNNFYHILMFFLFCGIFVIYKTNFELNFTQQTSSMWHKSKIISILTLSRGLKQKSRFSSYNAASRKIFVEYFFVIYFISQYGTYTAHFSLSLAARRRCLIEFWSQKNYKKNFALKFPSRRRQSKKIKCCFRR